MKTSTLPPASFAFLQQELGFHVVLERESNYYRSGVTVVPAGSKKSDIPPPVFGDHAVVLASNDFQVYFILDRGDLFIKLAPLGTPMDDLFQWYSLLMIRALVLKCDPNIEVEKDVLARFLTDCYASVRRLFEESNWEMSKRHLEWIGYVRITKMFGEMARDLRKPDGPRPAWL